MPAIHRIISVKNPSKDRFGNARLMRKRTVLRKQDGGALLRQVRICPALLGHKSDDFTLEIVGFFFIYRLASFGFDHNFDHDAKILSGLISAVILT